MFKFFLHKLFLIMVLSGTISGLKILGVMYTPARSHYYPFRAVMRGLVSKGHQVTVISFYNSSTSTAHPNLEEIVLPIPEVSSNDIPATSQEIFHVDEFETESSWNGLDILEKLGNSACDYMWSKPFQNFLHSNKSYDLLILQSFSTDCYLGLAEKFKVPFVHYSSCAMLPLLAERFGQPDNPSYITTFVAKMFGKMTFWERLANTLLHFKHFNQQKHSSVSKHYEIAKKVFGKDLRPFEEIAKEASLILMNTHFTVVGARPNVPGIIEIGGVHIEKVKKLPKNIEKWINESTDGVIYFSMGSMLKGHTFPEEKRKLFLKAFSRLKQRVLWKWENETMPDKPDNVMIQKWMPQFDILCHPNVKAFVAHGGLLGTIEAVHCGVPMVVMPQFGDQHTNARALEKGGGGVMLNFRVANEEMVYTALKTVLDPEFNKKAKVLSARFRDRPMSPIDTAIYWIEYVARHKGARHMRTTAVGMPLYQYLLLDVFGFIALCFFTALVIFVHLIKFALRLIFALFERRKTAKKQKEQ